MKAEIKLSDSEACEIIQEHMLEALKGSHFTHVTVAHRHYGGFEIIAKDDTEIEAEKRYVDALKEYQTDQTKPQTVTVPATTKEF